jgi:acetyl esterase/lipase
MPAALRDVRRVLDFISQRYPGPVIISGAAAGGGLATSTTAMRIAARKPPAGLLLFSPWLDLSLSSDAFLNTASADPAFSHARAQEAASHYLQGIAANVPLASPLFVDHAGFPPTFLVIGKGETMANESYHFQTAMQAKGVDVELLEISGMKPRATTHGLTDAETTKIFNAVNKYIERITLHRAHNG